MKKLYSFFLTCSLTALSFGQTTYLAEHFDYPAGDSLKQHGWYSHSGSGNNTIKVSNGGLSWTKTAYLGSGVGNAAAVSNNGSDENKPFDTMVTKGVNTGNIYSSFLLKVDKAVAGYFFHLGTYTNTSTPTYTSLNSGFRARTFIDSSTTSPDSFRMGLTFGSNTATYSPNHLKYGENYVVVVKYAFIDGLKNDSVSLFVFADGDDLSVEPSTPFVGPLRDTFSDASMIQAACLRQFNLNQRITVDGLLVQDAWNLVEKKQEPKYTKTIKFAVDMKNETVSNDGVFVAGNFQGWDNKANKLTQEGTSTIYSAYAEVDTNTVLEFKYINGSSWENVPALSQKGHTNNSESNGNRWAWSGNGADTLILPANLFNGNAPDGKLALRLAVDLQTSTKIVADSVCVAGSFQGWNPTSSRMVNLFSSNKVYEIIVPVDSNMTYQYKFINGDGWFGVESVPSTCGVGNDLNREIAIADTNMAAKKVCFGSCDACPGREIPKYNVTIQIDMKKECNFEKVDIAGGKINNWAGGDFLTDTDADGIYTITLKLDSGVEVAHKVRKIDAKGNINWEGGSDRKITVHGDSTFAVRCFGLDEACSGSVIAPSDILFQVDMSKEIPQDTIWVMGSFTSPSWQKGAIAMLPNKDNQDIYEVLVEKVCNEYFEYKFVNAVMSDNENGELFPDSTDRACVKSNGLGGFNRHHTRTGTDAVTLAYVYNSCSAIQNNQTKQFNDQVRIAPNPAKGSFSVNLNLNNGQAQILVLSLDGRVVRNILTNTANNTIEVNGLTGVYLVQISDNVGNTSVHKIVLQ